nr:MAG TPA: hypothetical protein [Crassvirales sp.]
MCIPTSCGFKSIPPRFYNSFHTFKNLIVN